eukprot:scaffold31968_cov101-Isochrysis_galbana.AAC.1
MPFPPCSPHTAPTLRGALLSPSPSPSPNRLPLRPCRWKCSSLILPLRGRSSHAKSLSAPWRSGSGIRSTPQSSSRRGRQTPSPSPAWPTLSPAPGN